MGRAKKILGSLSQGLFGLAGDAIDETMAENDPNKKKKKSLAPEAPNSNKNSYASERDIRGRQ